MINAAGNTCAARFNARQERISQLVSAIIDHFKAHQLSRAFTVAISRTNAVGKGLVSEQVI